VDAAFNSMNMPALVEFLKDCGIENPIICSSINKAGYLMSPDRQSYERVLQVIHSDLCNVNNGFRCSFAEEAIAYVTGLKHKIYCIRSIVRKSHSTD